MPPHHLASRMAKELKRLTKSPPPGVSAWPLEDSSSGGGGAVVVTTALEAQLQGPPDSPYCEGLFRLRVTVPERYPFEPPKVVFLTPVYHPNVDAAGRICLDFLSLPPKGSWGPAMDLFKLLVAVRQLLAEPNPRDPLVPEIAEEFDAQPELFRAKARAHTARHAHPATAAAVAASAAGSSSNAGGGGATATAAPAAKAAGAAGGGGGVGVAGGDAVEAAVPDSSQPGDQAAAAATAAEAKTSSQKQPEAATTGCE